MSSLNSDFLDLSSASADGAGDRRGPRGHLLVAHAADRSRARPVAASWCSDRCDELVIDWNATAYQVIKAEDGYADPLNASRALAMMHLAMHDAVNAAKPRYASYTDGERDAAADPAVAAVTAAHDVLAALYPKQAVRC